jgi:hypothetical protein
LAIPPASNFEGCSPFKQEVNPEKYSGKAILVNRGKCMFCVKIMNALTVNASAVIVSNSVDSFPIFMTWSSSCPAIADNPQIDPSMLGVPVCMASRVDGAKLLASFSSKLQLDFSGFRSYNPQSELLPENEISGIRVQQSIEDSYILPAGQVAHQVVLF